MTANIFDKKRIEYLRNQSASSIGDYDFLISFAVRSILDRLEDITLNFPIIAICGARINSDDVQKIIDACGATQVFLLDVSENLLKRHESQNYICVQADLEWLPFGSEDLDAIISVCDYHALNDLPGALIQARRALKPNGLFMAALPGGDTLYDLRDALTRAEIELYDGAAPHLFPFADKKQYGGLMQRAGYALPVVDSENINVSYETLWRLFEDIKGMGEGNSLIARHKKPLSRKYLQRVEALYRDLIGADPQGRFDAVFEIIHMIGWAPHESQQQPLKPGSAEHNLADILS